MLNTKQKVTEIMEYFSKPYRQWIMWTHIKTGKSHCETCLNLHERYFVSNKKPPTPLHWFCHCISVKIPYSLVLQNAESSAAISKFNAYIFNGKNNDGKSKEALFREWGYTEADCEYLHEEFIKQAYYKYINGDYKLGTLDKYRQRISIIIHLKRKNTGEDVYFVSGWMVDERGKIHLTTPYGGK